MTILETFQKFRDDFMELLKNNLKSKVDKEDGKGLSTNDYSNDEKNKLKNIENNANNSTLPTASSTLGGVKTTSTVSSANGHIACPIIGGVPYYKDTTYSLSSFGITATAAEINKLNGMSISTSELNNLKNSKSNIQSQIDAANSNITNHTNNKSNPHSITKAQLGLGNVENKTSADIRAELSKDNVKNALGFVPINYQAAGADLGVVKSGGSVTIANGIITVNNNSHTHTIANVTGLQDALNGKAASSHTHTTVNGFTPVKMTAAQYAAATKDANTIYFIVG